MKTLINKSIYKFQIGHLYMLLFYLYKYSFGLFIYFTTYLIIQKIFSLLLLITLNKKHGKHINTNINILILTL